MGRKERRGLSGGARALAWSAAACVVAGAVWTGPAARAGDIPWHLRLDRARAAAADSGKPVYVYIYSPAQMACKRMVSETLEDPDVKALLKSFECCAIDTTVPANKPIADKYAWGVSVDPVHETRFGSTPAHLFMDADGKEHYIRWGFFPAAAFAPMLSDVLEMVRLKARVAAEPGDARAAADLGRVLMALELFDGAKEHLQRAVANDPNNAVGAREDATLDLIILSIPDGPEQAHDALAKFLKDYPRTKRAVEVAYYQAVTLAAQATPAAYRAALKFLEPFKTADRTRPEFDSPWTLPALALDAQIRTQLGMRR